MLFLTPILLHDGTASYDCNQVYILQDISEHNGQSKSYGTINVKAEVLNKGVEEKTLSSVTGQKKLLSSAKKEIGKDSRREKDNTTAKCIIQKSCLPSVTHVNLILSEKVKERR